MTVDTVQLSRLDIEQLPGYKKHSAGQYTAGFCPACGPGDDRLCFWPERGNFWCRHCDLKGFVTEADSLNLNREDWLKWQAEETERKRQEQRKQLTILEQLQASRQVERYHDQMTDRSFWYAKGLTDEAIDYFELGYCPRCPTYPQSESYTIPISYQGKLYNIRHRLVNPGDYGKYRPEMSGLPSCMFNADALHRVNEWMIVLVEGEIKAMVLETMGFNTVGIPGASAFKSKWVKLFEPGKKVFIVLDPGAEEQALNIARMLAGRVEAKVCRMPVKPDDMFVKYGSTKHEFMQFLNLGETVR